MEHELQHITYTGNPMLAAGATTRTEDARRVSVDGLGQDEVESASSHDAMVKRLRTENDHLKEKCEQLILEIALIKDNEEVNDTLSHPSLHFQVPPQELPAPPPLPQRKNFPTFFSWLRSKTTALFDPDKEKR